MAFTWLSGFTVDGSVGIGTPTPSKELEVVGVIRSKGGTSSADFYSTGNDALIVNNGTSNLKFWNNGSEAMRINSAGYLGIGVSNSPSATLEVQGTGTSNSDIAHFSNSNSVTKVTIGLGVGGGIMSLMDGNNNEDIRLDSGGASWIMRDTGLGTDNPDRRLHVYDTATVVSIFEGTGAGTLIDMANTATTPGYSGVRFSPGGSNKMAITHIPDGTTKGYIQIGNSWATGSEILVVDGRNSNVGIGTTSPDTLLSVVGSRSHVSGDITISDSLLDLYNNLGTDTDEKGAILTFSDNYQSVNKTTRAAIKGGTDTAGNTADGFLAFYTDSGGGNSVTERMRINHDGYVGIGTATPLRKLDLIVDTTTDAVRIKNTNINGGGLSVFAANGGGGTNRILTLGDSSENIKVSVIENGNVGIGVTAPTSKLHINQNVTDPDLDQPLSFAVEIDSNHSGSAATTGDREQGGLFIDVDSSTTGGTITDEHRVYGIYNKVHASGDSDYIIGAYNYAEQNSTSGQTSIMRGIDGSAVSDGGSGANVSTMMGVYGSSNIQDASPVAGGYGGYFISTSHSNRTGATANMYGVRGEIQIDSTSAHTNLYAGQFSIDSNATYTATSAYLLHLNYAGTSLATNTYAIHSNSDVKSYHEGDIGIGTNSPSAKLHVEGDALISTTSPDLYFQTGATHANWRVSAQENISGAFEIGSSTASANAVTSTYTTRVIVKDTGTVGIGTNNSGAKLNIAGGIDLVNQGYGVTFGDYSASNPMTIREGLVGTEGADSDRITLYSRNSFTIFTYPNIVGGTQRAQFNTSGLDVVGDITASDDVIATDSMFVGNYIYHNGDTDTYIRYNTNQINFNAGGSDLLQIGGYSDGDYPTDSVLARKNFLVGTGGGRFIGNRINYATSQGWAVNVTGNFNSQPGYYGGNFGRNGSNAENKVDWGETPSGARGLIWTSINDSTSNDDGGWGKTITNLLGDQYSYMSIVYVRRTGDQSTGLGSFYHGCDGGNTLNLDGNANTNPYFQAPSAGVLPNGVWCVAIGIIQANSDSNTNVAAIGGLYRCDTGEKINGASTFKMKSGATQQTHRTYLYYSTNVDNNLEWFDPGFYTIDGSEPTLNDIISNNVIESNYLPLAGGTMTGAIAMPSNVNINWSGASIRGEGNILKLLGTEIQLQNPTVIIGGTSGTSDKLTFKTADNSDPSAFIRKNAYYLEFGSNQNEGFKFTDVQNSVTLLQLNGGNNATGNGANSATFAGSIIPLNDAAKTLGTSTKRWNYAYINNSLTVTDGNINAGSDFDFNQGADFDGKVRATSTVAADAATTLTTKDWVQGLIDAIPAGLSYEGTWNASTDSPALAGTTPANGVFYIVSTAGSTSLSGITDWEVGDWAVFVSDGAGTDAWQKVDNTSVLNGSGTGGTVTGWATGSPSNTLTNSPITYSGTTVTMPGTTNIAGPLQITTAGSYISMSGSGSIGSDDNFYVGGANNGTDHTYIGDSGRNVTIYNGATFTVASANTVLNGQLDVNPDADSGLTIGNAGTDAVSIYGKSGDELYLGGGGSWSVRYPAANNYTLFDNTNARVGIGTGSPAAPLHVAADSTFKVIKLADDLTTHYKVTGLADHTLTMDCSSYYQAEVVITANQTNGGTYNNLYVRGIWSNNHTSHQYDEIENIGNLTGSSFTITVSAGSVSNSGRLVIFHDYGSASFSQMVVRVTDFYGTHTYTIT